MAGNSALAHAAQPERGIRPAGGYRRLRSYQVATLIFDGTMRFCDRFVDRRSRTHDQMVQAARSGQKNIAEGSRASATTSQNELRLVNVARASLEELLLDYEDYLRQHHYRAWTKDDPEAIKVRAIGRKRAAKDPTDQSDQSDLTDPSAHWKLYARWLEQDDPAVVANTLICLIHQANYLLDQQRLALERDFVREGGYTEKLAAARVAARQQVSVPVAPCCPQCGRPMVGRTARTGAHAGSQFWGCANYPACKGIRQMD